MDDRLPRGRQLEILSVLWELGSASVRQVHERLCPDGELAFNTVQTQLRIMDDKGLVTHRVEGRTFVYSPVHSREREASRWLNYVFEGALDQMIVSLLKTEKPSATELKDLQKIIANARRKSGGKHTKQA